MWLFTASFIASVQHRQEINTDEIHVRKGTSTADWSGGRWKKILCSCSLSVCMCNLTIYYYLLCENNISNVYLQYDLLTDAYCVIRMAYKFLITLLISQVACERSLFTLKFVTVGHRSMDRWTDIHDNMIFQAFFALREIWHPKLRTPRFAYLIFYLHATVGLAKSYFKGVDQWPLYR